MFAFSRTINILDDNNLSFRQTIISVFYFYMTIVRLQLPAVSGLEDLP
ncbi:10838_t:CDS:2 [Entrophospora sp. SA101]|nr:10838_t:CDS:2 [Entrophospora sp. SA101]